MSFNIDIKHWGAVSNQVISLYQISAPGNFKVGITNYGATIQSICTPDQHGELADVVLGYNDLQQYRADIYYMGGIVGRFANRIANGKVMLSGKPFQLSVNEDGFHHHGGHEGFNKKVWEATPFKNKQNAGVILRYISPDGEEGFPGKLSTKITYTITDKKQIIVDYYAETNKQTLINLTQHTYFNLEGHLNGSVLDHYLTIPHDKYLPVNQIHVPVGEPASTKSTPFDFTTAKQIGHHINDNDEQLMLGKGYDHTWVIKPYSSTELKPAAMLTAPISNRTLKVYTTEPSIHVYTGNYLDAVYGKNNAVYGMRSALCLETQHFPDAPNHPEYPSTVLNPGTPFASQTIFEFGINHSTPDQSV